jgi:germination protein YpeB
LDNGDVVGMESRGYIMSHTDRTLPTNLISEDIARGSINKHLAIDDVRLAIIPLDSKREVLCYEFRGSFNNQNYLIYINAETGAEEKILLLMETDEGVLTM